MRASTLLSLAAVALTLNSCAHRGPAPARACANSMSADAKAWNTALQAAYPDPRGHHSLITARLTDDKGNRVTEADVWPLSGPQEPAPPKKVRVVQQPCTLEIIAIVRFEQPAPQAP
jgi:hypothetical protein